MKIQRSKFVKVILLVALILTGLNLFTASPSVSAQAALYTSCDAQKLTEPLAQPAASATQAATASATMAATQVATAAATGSDEIAFLSIVGSESQACYLATEKFLEGNFMNMKVGFNNAIGITKTIKGDIALDRSNVANSQIGDIVINISEFKSDNDRRDGFIRQNFLQSNKYPFATLTNATAIGLPAGAYKDGTKLTFQIKGTLTVHDSKRDTTFDATGSFTAGTLVVTATADLKMSDFGIQTPDIAGLLKVDDALRLVVNLVAREQTAAATPAK